MSGSAALRAGTGAPADVIVAVGRVGVLVRDAEAAVRARVLEGPFASLNHAVFTAGEEAAGGFREATHTQPMMAARRLVEIRQVQEASAALLDAILAYVQAPSPCAVLLLCGERFPAASGGIDRGVRIRNAVKKTGMVLELDGDGIDPRAFVTERARALGVEVERSALASLVEVSGGDLGALAADVETCAHYAGPGGTIDTAAVAAVCPWVAEASVWALTDAIVARDADLALATLHRLLEDGEAPHKLLGSIAWQLRQALLVQDAFRRGIPEREAGIRMPPGKIRAIREAVGARPQSPSQVLEALARVNHRMNSSRAGDRRQVEAFVLQLVSDS
jgi:DNA polymerase-3 subunit delta